MGDDLVQQAPTLGEHCPAVLFKGNPNWASVTAGAMKEAEHHCSTQIFDYISALVNPDQIWNCRSAVACTYLKSWITCKHAPNFFQGLGMCITESSSTLLMVKKEEQFSPTATALKLTSDPPLTFLNSRNYLSYFYFYYFHMSANVCSAPMNGMEVNDSLLTNKSRY